VWAWGRNTKEKKREKCKKSGWKEKKTQKNEE